MSSTLTDWRALCEKLVDELEKAGRSLRITTAEPERLFAWADEAFRAAARARAELSQSEPEVAGPTRLRTERRTGPFGEWTALIPCNSPAPAPAGEVGELVAALKVIDKMQQEWVLLGNDDGTASPSLTTPISLRRFTVIRDALTRAADLLERQAATVPVAVSERPWEREGWCDKQGQCWMGDPGGDGFIPSWRLCHPEDAPRMRVSLPAHALPLPAGEVQP